MRAERLQEVKQTGPGMPRTCGNIQMKNVECVCECERANEARVSFQRRDVELQ